METTLKIGENCNVYSYNTVQQGYGRQGLSVELKRNDIDFDIKRSFVWVYVKSVFPNIEEHYDDYLLESNAFYDEEKDVYFDNSGREFNSDCIFETITDLLNHVLNGMEFEIEED